MGTELHRVACLAHLWWHWGAGSMHTQTTCTMAVGNVRQAGGNQSTMAAVVAAVMEVVVVIGGKSRGKCW